MMSKRILLTVVALLAFAAGLSIQDGSSHVSEALPAQVPPSNAGEAIPGRYIVMFQNNVDTEGYLQALERLHGFVRTHVFSQVFRGFAAEMPAAVASLLRLDPNVVLVEQDSIVHASPQTLPTGIERMRADENATAAINGSGADLNVDVAVIDTGVASHSELRIQGGFASYGAEVCTGFFIRRCSIQCAAGTSSFSDQNGHGTHVAGTIGARDNTAGVVGVAPGARLWAVRVLGSTGTGCMSDVIAGVNWVTQNASTIEVANISITGPNSTSLCTAINSAVSAGVVIVVAAGNGDAQGSPINASNVSPANCTNAITVAAVADYNGEPGGGAGATCAGGAFGGDDSLASFSNYGSVVDIAAPGVCILSTWPGGGVATLSGTSMASPHTAGAAALDILVNGKPTNSSGVNAVRNRLVNAGFPQNSDCGYATHHSLTVPLLNVGPNCGPAEPDTTPPNPPTGLGAEPGNGEVELDWTPSSSGDVTQQRIYRGTSSGNYGGSPIATLAAGATSYTDTSANNGTTYFYIVRAFDGTFESANSNEASAMPEAPPDTPPAAPTGLTASGGNGQISLNWADNSEADLDGYNVYRSTTNGGPYAQVNGALVGPSAYTDSGLTNGTTYYYVVTAVDEADQESVNSAQASATPSAPTCTGWRAFFGLC